MRTVKRFEDYFIDLAFAAATRSKDPSTNVGAIIVDGNRDIVATGYNGFPSGIQDTEERWNDRPTKYKLVVHAEANAIARAASGGRATKGATLYCTHLPCMDCAKLIIAAGITKVVAKTIVRGNGSKFDDIHKQSIELLDEAGIEWVYLGEETL